jgi:RNA polymerase sigma factor (sigma-70 family)
VFAVYDPMAPPGPALFERGRLGSSMRPALSPLALQRLAERLAERDPAVLSQVYDAFSPGVLAVALRVTGDSHAAEDITQDVFVDLWRSCRHFDPERGSLRAWLATIAHHQSVDWLRREQAGRRREVQAARGRACLEHIPDLAATVEAVVAGQRVRLALAALPEEQRLPITLAYFGRRSYRQVAEDLGIPEGTIKCRIRSGLSRLADSMQSETCGMFV